VVRELETKEYGREVMCLGPRHAVRTTGWRLRATECLERAELVP
jgi:hypothetical protein